MHTIISKSGIIASFLEKGAELTSLKNLSGKEYIWEGNPEFWGKHSPILFPIVGTLKDNFYLYNNQEYHLSRHGFARDRKFSVLSKSENSIVFSLEDSDETLAVYPFHFELQVQYTLNENSLEIRYSITNKNDLEMPFSIGAHPAFALSENFEDYSIEFETDQKLAYHLLENDLISSQTSTLHLADKILPLCYKLFENDALVFKSIPAKEITILESGKPRIKVSFPEFPDLGIWTKVGAPFLCIEPWFGYSDSAASAGNILKKDGIQLLDPKKSFQTKFEIEVF